MKEAAIGVIYSHDRSQVLLVKRLDVPVWVLPGGGIDPGETPEEAVVREVIEETGLTVRISRKVAEYSPINRFAQLTHLFECERLGGSLSASSETSDLDYWNVHELPDSFFMVHKDWLNDSLQNTPSLVRKEISQVNCRAIAKYFLKHPLHVVRFLLTRMKTNLTSGKS